MNHEINRLILYSDLGEDEILRRVADVFEGLEKGKDQAELRSRLLWQGKRILDLATAYGFDENLWQNYLTFLMIGHVHSFALTCEGRGAGDGSINAIAEADFGVFRRLFHYDFSALESALDTDLLTRLSAYRAIPKGENIYNRDVSERVRELSRAIAAASSDRQVFDLMVDHYRRFGAGFFGLNRAFRVKETAEGIRFEPISNVDHVVLSDLIGYELQKKALRENVEAFVAGRAFNNMLLYGDAGTGKSTSVKAVMNEYWRQGLRVIEINKYQFGLLSQVISQIKARNYRFMLFLDDLSFEEDEAEYKYLKAVIEGGLETRPRNVMICATSNRRHLIKETWKDRADMEHDGDVHRSDTMEEKLSLAARFGCTISYFSPDRKLFESIVRALAERHPEIRMDEKALLAAASRWELRHGGLSGRTAQQFIDDLAGKSAAEQEQSEP